MYYNITVKLPGIDWDENKNAKNKARHKGLSLEALDEFAALARELRIRKNRRDTKPVIALRIEPEALAKYKALGKGYTGTMGDVLNYVANNPEILAKVL